MSYHIVNIDDPKVCISCRQGQLCCTDSSGNVRSLPMEDVASVVITSFSPVLHGEFLSRAAEFGIAVILCKNFQPVSILMPANRSSDTLLTKAFVCLDERRSENLWQKTVDAKCANQLFAATLYTDNFGDLKKLSIANTMKCVEKESVCARYYWQLFGAAVGDKSFNRVIRQGGANDLLNFGYVMLTSVVLQKLFAYGLDPSFGIGHKIRERAAPLAYDIMEPFRVFIDLGVVKWIKMGEDAVVDTAFKRFITKSMLNKVPYMDASLDLSRCIEKVVGSFRRAIKEKDNRYYKPWTGLNSKWDGCL